jgi:hypothetical protein
MDAPTWSPLVPLPAALPAGPFTPTRFDPGFS